MLLLQELLLIVLLLCVLKVLVAVALSLFDVSVVAAGNIDANAVAELAPAVYADAASVVHVVNCSCCC